MAEKLEIIITAKDKFSGALKSLRGMLPSVKTLAIGAGAGASALGAGLFAIANSTAKAGDEFQKMSLRLGLSTELLSGMKHAVELSGASMESLEKGVRTLAKRMSDADEGLIEAQRSFEALGIQVNNADGSLRDLDTMMAEAAQGLANMEDNTKRVALAQELFGRSGTALLPLFKQGAEGLRKMTEEAKALGITFDKVSADQAAAFRDNMLRLQRVFTGIKTQIGQAIIPLFSEWMAIAAEAGKRIVKYVRENQDAILNYAESFISAIGKMALIGAYGIAGLIDSWRGLKMIWQVLKIAFLEFMQLVHAGMAKLTDSMASLLDKINFQGQFDSIIERVIAFGNQSAVAMANLEMSSNRAKDALGKLIDEPLAIHQVTDFTARIKATIEELRGLAASNGIPPFDTENTEITKDNINTITDAQRSAIAALQEMWNEYYLTEAERIDLWYIQEQEKYAGNREALNQLDEVYFAKHLELAEKSAEDRARAEDLANERIKNSRMRSLQNLTNIGLLFGKKGMAISKMLAIPHAYMATREAAIQSYKALAGIPIIGPALGFAAAAAATLYGMQQVGLIKAAHSGLTSVPREQAYVLARNERVISEPQNRDLTEFLAGREAGLIEMHNTFHLFENAHTADTIRQLPKKELKDLIEDKFIPALRDLKLAGVTI